MSTNIFSTTTMKMTLKMDLILIIYNSRNIEAYIKFNFYFLVRTHQDS